MADLKPLDTPVDETVTYLPPTKDASVATGNQNPGAPNLASSVPFLGEAIDVAGKINDSQKTTSNLESQKATFDPELSKKSKQDYLSKEPGSLDASATQTNESLQKIAGVVGDAGVKAYDQQKDDQSKAITSLIKDNEYSAQEARRFGEAAAQAETNLQNFIDNPNKINPENYVENLGVSGKTVAALGMILGGIGAGLTGGPNYAIQAFQKNIDRDIAAQTTKNEQFMKALTVKKGFSLDNANVANNKLMAGLTATATVLTGALAVAKSAIDKAKSTVERDAANVVYQQLQIQMAQLKAQYTQSTKGLLSAGATSIMGLAADLANNVSTTTYGKGTSDKAGNILGTRSESNPPPQPQNQPQQQPTSKVPEDDKKGFLRDVENRNSKTIDSYQGD